MRNSIAALAGMTVLMLASCSGKDGPASRQEASAYQKQLQLQLHQFHFQLLQIQEHLQMYHLNNLFRHWQ